MFTGTSFLKVKNSTQDNDFGGPATFPSQLDNEDKEILHLLNSKVEFIKDARYEGVQQNIILITRTYHQLCQLNFASTPQSLQPQ